MMLVIMTVLAVLLAILAAGQFWLLIKITRRNEDLTFQVEDRDRAAFSDIQTMFALQERLDRSEQARRDAITCLEMVLDG